MQQIWISSGFFCVKKSKRYMPLYVSVTIPQAYIDNQKIHPEKYDSKHMQKPIAYI